MRPLLLLLVVFSGCVKVVPPPPMPERVVPVAEQPDEPAARGSGRLLIDTVGQSAAVEETLRHVDTARGYTRDVYRLVCASTPCSVDLPYGAHELRFTSLADPTIGGVGALTVSGKLSAYRYAMGRDETPWGGQLGGLLGISFGVAAGMLGAMFVGIGAETNPLTMKPENLGLQPAGFGLLIGSAALLVTGAVLLAVFRSEHEDGAGVAWPL